MIETRTAALVALVCGLFWAAITALLGAALAVVIVVGLVAANLSAVIYLMIAGGARNGRS